MKKVSILIPLFNAERYIAETINSALMQTWKNKEIIIVDDGSTDESYKIAKQFESKIVKVYSQENKGASSARNKAFKLSSGYYIQYLDADDLLSPTKIETQMNLFELFGDEVVVFCHWDRFRYEITEAKFPNLLTNHDWTNPIDCLVNFWKGNGMTALHCWLSPRKLIEKAGHWNENLSLNDDGEFFSRVLLNANSIKFCDNAFVYYRSDILNSLSQSKSENKARSLLLSYKHYENNILQKEDSLKIRKVLLLNYSSFVYQYYPKFPDLISEAYFYANSLGFKKLLPTGGKYFKTLSKIIGFNNSLKLKKLIHNI